MGTESIEASFLSIFALITFFIFLIISKYSFKIKNGVLLDTNFSKPQAFHENPVSRSGGIASILSLCVFFYIYNLLYSEILYNYIYMSLSMFLIGLIALRIGCPNIFPHFIILCLFSFFASRIVLLSI